MRRVIQNAGMGIVGVGLLMAGCARGGASLPSNRSAKEANVVSTEPNPPREDEMNPIILKEALTNIDTLEKTLAWKPFKPGVEIARIYSTPDKGPTAAFLKYQPGASVPLHMHASYEHIFILKGSQLDRTGEHPAGTVIINPPGSSHTVSSPNGCIVLIIWDEPVILV